MISLCKYNGNAYVRNHLQKEDSGHSSETKSTVDSAEAGGSTGLVAITTLLGRLAALCSGVNELALAEVLALEELLLRKALVESTGLVQLAGRLDVEGTLDVVEVGSLDAGKELVCVQGFKESKLLT